MNREKAKALLPIIQAFAEGKTIEHCDNGAWWCDEDLSFSGDPSEYRIKPEPKYRPFANAEEFKPHRDRWLRHKSWNDEYRRPNYFDNQTTTLGSSSYNYPTLLSVFTFEDGSPCGVLVTE